MWEEILSLLVGVPIVVALTYLVPRHVARAWAIWLLVCLIVVSLQGIGQAVFNEYNPEKLDLHTEKNRLEFYKDEAGKLVRVVVHKPPEHDRMGRPFQGPLASFAGACLALASAILALLLRAEPSGPPPEIAATSSGKWTGISLQAFGVAVLLASLAQAIAKHSGPVNLIGMVVIAAGYYVGRGSRLAAKWALALMVVFSVISYPLFASLIADANKIGGTEWATGWGGESLAITIGLAAMAWAAVNLVLTIRFLWRAESSAEPTGH